MTDTKIDTLQNYFGIALRQNVEDIDKMISKWKASMFHVGGCNKNCPKNQEQNLEFFEF